MVWCRLYFVFGSLLTLWLFFLSRGMGNMSTGHKYDFSWGEGCPVGGIRNVFNTHKYGFPCTLRVVYQ